LIAGRPNRWSIWVCGGLKEIEKERFPAERTVVYDNIELMVTTRTYMIIPLTLSSWLGEADQMQ
jgi:hypothetical protein